MLALVSLPFVSFTLARAGILGSRFGPFTVPEYLALTLALFTFLGVMQRVKLARRLSDELSHPDSPESVN